MSLLWYRRRRALVGVYRQDLKHCLLPCKAMPVGHSRLWSICKINAHRCGFDSFLDAARKAAYQHVVIKTFPGPPFDATLDLINDHCLLEKSDETCMLVTIAFHRHESRRLLHHTYMSLKLLSDFFLVFTYSTRLPHFIFTYTSLTSGSPWADEKLKAAVADLLGKFGTTLWPDFIPPWAFDPSDHKQFALNTMANEYPKQLRYSDAGERAT